MTVMEGWPAETFSSPLFSLHSSPGLLPVLSLSLPSTSGFSRDLNLPSDPHHHHHLHWSSSPHVRSHRFGGLGEFLQTGLKIKERNFNATEAAAASGPVVKIEGTGVGAVAGALLLLLAGRGAPCWLLMHAHNAWRG
ncbi:hypothetical protein NC652_016871 [Populus alba x Populus x berolinensis]|nr:hypothetical protein NC652_016869 [Populus alba x Populus x berolinensis]KAJ6923366.1 hypothetical protein NC652_016871 [Populus alba x Populus x berolinensis]